MANDLQLPQPNINPGVIGGSSGFAPNAIDMFMSSFLDARKQKSSESAQARQDAIAQGHLDLAREQLKLQQEQERTQQAQHDQQGGAVQAFLKMLQPLGEASAQKAMASGQDPLSSLFGAQQGQGSPLAMPVQNQQQGPQQPVGSPNTPTATPGPQAPPNWGEMVQNMSPAAAAAFVHEQLPQLLSLQKQIEGGGSNAQAIQTGDTVTTFVPGKGFWDSESKSWVPSIERKMPADVAEMKRLELQLQRERIGAMQDYRTSVSAQRMTRSFVTNTKKIRERGMFINQAIQTIGDAQNNPDPNARKVLTTSAIANFIQAADQNAQLRIQLLNYFKDNVDPSIAGRWNVLKTRLIEGTLPKYVTSGLLQHLNNLLVMSRSEYERQRSGEIKRHPELGNWLPESDEYFTVDHPNGSVPSDELPPPP